MRAPRMLIAWAAAALVALLAPSGAGHPGDHGTITIEDVIVLTPAGTEHSNFHALLSTLGIPFGKGDHFVFEWKVVASAERVEFDIHSHSAEDAYRIFHRNYASSDSSTWIIPATQDYMVYWNNPASGDVAVSYRFALEHPSVADSDPVGPAHLAALVAPAAALLLFAMWTSPPRAMSVPLTAEDPEDDDEGRGSKDLEAEARRDEL